MKTTKKIELWTAICLGFNLAALFANQSDTTAIIVIIYAITVLNYIYIKALFNERKKKWGNSLV